MTADEMSEITSKAQAEIARIDSAHTEENRDRLKVKFEKLGWKLTGTLRRKSGFALRSPDGNTISGISLDDAEGVLTKMSSDGKR